MKPQPKPNHDVIKEMRIKHLRFNAYYGSMRGLDLFPAVN